METTKQPRIDDLFLKWVTVIPGILIFFGLEELLIYYGMFDINILEFITLSDALITAVDYVIYYAVSLLLLKWFTWRSIERDIDSAKMTLENAKSKKTKLTEEESTEVKEKINRSIIKIGIGVIFIILACVVIYLSDPLPYSSNQSRKAFYLLAVAGVVLVVVVLFICDQLTKTFGWGNNGNVFKNVTMLFTTFAWYILTVNVSAAVELQTSDNNPGPMTAIVLNDKTSIELDSNFVYIGRIENFTFLYNKSSKERQLIRNGEIKSYTYRGK